jgi:uncharacterized protein with von Willebrand factor type A (vWA) domain
MLTDFFQQLRKAGIPVSILEFLTLLEAMQKHLAFGSAEDFYYLARLCMVKDETHFDKFDRVFMEYFKGISVSAEDLNQEIPEEWLRKLAERFLTDEEKQQIQALGGLDKLMETLKKRLEEQKERHQGGSKWIGTGGTSPFGAYGYNPEGIRIGQTESRHRRAVKVWEKREFRDLDDSVELGTRNMKVALRKLRTFAREGEALELDLPGTIRATAGNAGFLDIKMVPERHNKVKVLLFLDVGGSMDPHIEICQQLFSAARSEFKHLEYFYFHNFVYERLWRENKRRWDAHLATTALINQFGPDYKLVIVGDASMSPYEIHMSGGSVEHHNAEPGSVWLKRLTDHFRRAVWLNPEPQQHWKYTHSVQITQQLMAGQMFPLNMGGIERAIKFLGT